MGTVTVVLGGEGGFSTIIDEADAPAVLAHEWHAHQSKRRVYARNAKLGRLSRWLLGVGPGVLVQHVNRNTLDDRRENLRVATMQQISAGARRRRDSKNRYKGIEVKRGRWRAVVSHSGRRLRSAAMSTALAAALEYDRLALQEFGDFAGLNFPERKRLAVIGCTD